MNKTGMEIFDILSSDQTEDSIVVAFRKKYADEFMNVKRIRIGWRLRVK